MSQTHSHSFGPYEWPFDDPENVTAITTVHVLEGRGEILLVIHEDDGTWQVLCASTNEPADDRVVCLGCMYQRDPTIGAVADLPRGWAAWRDSGFSPWRRQKSPWSKGSEGLFAAFLFLGKPEKVGETDDHVYFSAPLDSAVLLYRPADLCSSTYRALLFVSSLDRMEGSLPLEFASDAEALAWFPQEFDADFRGGRVIELRREPHEGVEEFIQRIEGASGGALRRATLRSRKA
jgi:hypothetical protein